MVNSPVAENGLNGKAATAASSTESQSYDAMHFTFSDTIAGYVTSFDAENDSFGLKTSDGRTFNVKITNTTYAELMRNLGEPFHSSDGQLRDMLKAGRYLFTYGIFYPQRDDYQYEAKHIIFTGRENSEYRFEKVNWWVQQVTELGDFYLRSQFGDGEIDYRKYTTSLALTGAHTDQSYRQETDTISRLVYGFASAYMITGDERFLEAADKGTKYLREHMRFYDQDENVTYWYHAIEVVGNKERKIFASEFGDDYDAIPAYEQIYALAGPTQTYRITGDQDIMQDIDCTMALFDKHYLDREGGGYYSHIDPITLSALSGSLGRNRARKNWNSVGDHAPAYLINLWLATGKQEHADMLAYTADTIVEHFPDYDASPFVQERFFEDWSHDHEWGWQQDRAVVGHNLKIAWNLMRIYHMNGKQEYVDLAKKIGRIMPTVGMDRQRSGWYDVMERTLNDDEEFYRYVWHDRKAWWQQEQAILAYLILAGSLNDSHDLKIARESAAFYNAFFLDHDDGGVYFNVLADGIPYLMGTERKKGSHSMSGYHSFELAYLAATYTNLLITKQPMSFYFKPTPNSLPDRQLRVQPDILPQGSVRIDQVWIDDQEYFEYDSASLTVKLPEGDTPVRVQVRLAPTTEFDRELS